MRRRRRRVEWGIFPLAGWLFTDLLLAMMMVFLITSRDGIPNVKPVVRSTVTATATPPPVVCGIDKNYREALVTVSDPYGVRALNPSAMNSFFNDVKANGTLQSDAHRVAGVVEVFGGSGDVGDGVSFAAGAIQSLKDHSDGQFIFSSRTVYFKPLWDGTIKYNQVRIYLFYYILAASCGPK